MIGTRFAGLAGVGALLALAAAAPIARAQAPGDAPARRDPIAAEALFTRGKQLVEQGRTAEACEAFRESQRLDPAGGTLLRLALCHEADRKLASAWLEFTEVVRISQGGGGDPAKLGERVRLAREHLEALEPRLPKLVVNVDSGARADGLAVTANGLPRGEGTWGVAIPVDPGDVSVEATAPGRQPFRSVVRAVEGKQTAVDVPALEAAPATASGAATAPPVAGEAGPAPTGSSLRTAALIIGGAGVVVAGIGAYFGVTAMSKWSDSNQHCPGSVCDAQGAQSAHDAKQAAGLSDVTVGLGVAALATGAILYFVGAPKTVTARADGVAVAF